jgi:putative acetyltransferase
MSIKTRQASPEDLDAILLLFKETIETMNARDYSFEQIKVWSNGVNKKESWLRKIEEQFFIVVEFSKNIVGFGSITNQGYLDFMYVSKHHQGMGIAKAIYQQLEEFANLHQLDKIISEVSITAKPFFEKLGFVLVQEQQITIDRVQLKNYRMAKTLR